MGTFVVLRGLAFVGDALAHGVLPGIATALILGLPGIVGAVVGAALMIGGVGLVTRATRLSSDTAIGLLFVGMLALGVAIVSRSQTFTGDLTRILFGDVLGSSWSDIGWQAVTSLAVIAIAGGCARPFLLLCIDPEAATTAGFRAGRYHAFMLILVAVTVVASFQTVGTLLVFGMIVAPPATAALVARRVGAMIAISATIGVLSVWIGLSTSYAFDLAAGASIVLVQVGAFALTLVAVELAGRRAPAVGTA